MSAAAITAHLAARTGVSIRQLVWLEARDRATGAAAPIGLWSGAENATFVIQGQARTYLGAGGLVSVEPIRSRAGLAVQMQRIVLSGIAPEAAIAVRGRDIRMAGVEIDVLHLTPVTGAEIGIERVFEGQVDRAPIDTGAAGGEATITITAASAARHMTKGLTALRSDANQRRRGGDAFFQYAAVGQVRVWWGQQRP